MSVLGVRTYVRPWSGVDQRFLDGHELLLDGQLPFDGQEQAA
jgi:hypothetical protein